MRIHTSTGHGRFRNAGIIDRDQHLGLHQQDVVFLVDVVQIFPVNYTRQLAVKDVDHDVPWLLWCGHPAKLRSRGHAFISELIKVAQKLECAVQLV